MIYVYLVLVIVLFAWAMIRNKRIKERGYVLDKKLKGKGKAGVNGALSPVATVTDIQSAKKNGKMMTVVTFSDGFTFTTSFCKTHTIPGITSVRYEFLVDEEVRMKIIDAAVAEHSKML